MKTVSLVIFILFFQYTQIVCQINPELDLVRLETPEIDLNTGGIDVSYDYIPDLIVPTIRNNTNKKSPSNAKLDAGDYLTHLVSKYKTPVDKTPRINLDEAFKYNDRSIGYQPGLNMEDLYANSKPSGSRGTFTKGAGSNGDDLIISVIGLILIGVGGILLSDFFKRKFGAKKWTEIE